MTCDLTVNPLQGYLGDHSLGGGLSVVCTGVSAEQESRGNGDSGL